MIWFFLLLSLLGAWADIGFWQREIRTRAWSRSGQIILLIGLLFTTFSPLIGVALTALLSDNSTLSLQVWMWLNWLFLATVPPRMLYYGFHRSGHQVVRLGGGGVILTYLILLVVGTTVGRSRLRVEEVEIRSERLPESFDGVRLLHFSDLHIGTLLRPEKETSRLVKQINALQPDLILFTGDLVNIRHTELSEQRMLQLGSLKAPLGVWAVTGNHDIGLYIRDTLALTPEENTRLLLQKEQQMGWQVLENESRLLMRGCDTISISGIAFDQTLRDFRHAFTIPEEQLTLTAYDHLPKHYFNLTLCHLPQLWRAVRAEGFGDLMLSGHVHSMQHKIPWGERGFSLAALLYREWSGLYEEQGDYLYINDGIGSVGFPFRLGTRPELTLITLKRP